MVYNSPLHKQHRAFLLRCLNLLPHQYQGEDSSRVALAFFGLASLDVLGELDEVYKVDSKRQTAGDWLINQQSNHGGFCGGPSTPTGLGHLLHSLFAVLSLGILGQSLDRVNRASLLKFVNSCQNSDGRSVRLSGLALDAM